MGSGWRWIRSGLSGRPVGGVLSTNDSGALRLRFGSLRDLVIGATVALADGTLASSGGKVVKNVAGYDLPKLMTGAFGTLGVITRAIFRLHPLPKEARTFSFITVDAAQAQRLALSIQNSKLAHSALQFCCGAEMQPRVDVLFEGTEAGLSAQGVQLKLIASEATQGNGTGEVWGSRQKLFSRIEGDGDNVAVAKFATLPAETAEAVKLIEKVAASELRWSAVAQATGIGWVRMGGARSEIAEAMRRVREWIEDREGSLVIVRRPTGIADLDVWGNSGDALGLMQAVKRQFDPLGTLNPGRFVGGI
jgi:glycolate oxidase FAD binding subunit